ncbi:MAG TPA: adenine phosphoribosyltransferase [Verrucomicrobia bacterium]|nr:adenine phosphoribosyltransferase [Verrucomicrobiota bacterium]HCG19799.1 adenine phosphoribosyltransferase [Verrucomicrobiota bacterium]
METNPLSRFVRAIPDFPKKGVLFRDVTGILDSAEGFHMALDQMQQAINGTRVDIVVAPESRGFIFGAALADRLSTAFAPIRKPGKLPRETVAEAYDLEYGSACLHLHCDAIKPGQSVVFVDDLLATGGTALAGAHLVEKLGGRIVKMVFPIELEGFNARHDKLKDYDVVTLVKYPGK